MTTPILFVIDNLEFGGGERGFLQLIEALVGKGWPVTVAAQPGGVFETRARQAGAEFLALDMTARLPLLAVRRLRRAIRAGRFAIVHSQGARADFVARLALVGLSRVRNVCTVQMPVEGFDVAPLRKRFYLTLDRLSGRRVDRYIVVSRALERALVGGRGLAPERVTLVYNGIEVEPLDRRVDRVGPSTALRERLGLESGARVIGAVGRLVWQKGFEHLIRAMADVRRRVPSARLLVAGDGPLRSALEALARDVVPAGTVRFIGFQADVPRFLAGVETLVIPSVREGFPMITLEAMALGTPIVATAIDGIVEQIDHEVEGLLVQPADTAGLASAIVRLLEDGPLRERVSGSARRRAVTFDLSVSVGQTERVYAELLSDRDLEAR